LAALSEIEKLEARWAENPDGRYFAPLADAYRKAGRVEDAIQVVTVGLAKHPDYLSAHIVLGRCHLEKSDDAGARGAFEKVLSLDSENIIALKSLAEIAERGGATDEARRWLQRLLAVDAMNTEAADDLERLGGPLGDAAAAADEAPVALTLDEPEAMAVADDATLPMPSIDIPEVPQTLERAAVRFSAEPPPPPPAPEPIPEPEPEPVAEPLAAEAEPTPEPAPLPMLDLEPTGMDTGPAAEPAGEAPPLELEPAGFQAPSTEEVPPAADLQPFDDQLEWGAGERQSQAVHAEDVVEAESHHEATAAAIDFLGATEPPRGEAPHDELAAHESAKASEAELAPAESEAPLAAAAEPAAVAPEPVEESAPAELPLILPEDVTPEEELRRPSARQVETVSPEPPVAEAGEPMVTETMGDLYLKQGHRDKAADVFRRLLAARPDDAGLQAKLAAIESPPDMAADSAGAEPVGSWLRRIAGAHLPAPAPSPAPEPEPGPTPMEQAFAAAEAEPEAPPPAAPPPSEEAAEASETPGRPARPATDQYSLDRLFGSSAPEEGAVPTPPPHSLGASFDEFFGASAQPDTVRPKEDASSGGPQSDDDLSAFTAWLHGLKR